MADKIVVVGLEVGDDYTSLGAALSALPTDLTTTGFDNWVIQCRNDQTHSRFTLPTFTADNTHRLILRAYSGNETNGKGEGATIESNSGLGVIRGDSTLSSYFSLDGISVKQTGSSRAILVLGDFWNIQNCFIQSVSGAPIEVANGNGVGSSLNNVILKNETGTICLNWSTGDSGTTRTINRVTAVGGTSFSFNRSSSTEEQARKENYTNCLALPNGGQGWPNISATSRVFDSDFNASSDTSAISASLTTGFPNRVITDDLEDPNGVTPNYNLKATSTLKGAGIGGSDIGATLPASTSSGINITPTTVGSTWATNNYTVDLTGSIDITPQSVGSTWSANNYTVDLTGEISITPQSVGSTWTANNYTVQLDSGIIVTPQSVGSTWAANNYSVVLSGVIDITPQSAGVNWQTNNYTVTLSSVVINGKHVRRVNAKIKNVRIGAKSKIKRFN